MIYIVEDDASIRELEQYALQTNGYEAAGPMFNIYHVSPHDTKNPDEFVTEVCYPVKKK